MDVHKLYFVWAGSHSYASTGFELDCEKRQITIYFPYTRHTITFNLSCIDAIAIFEYPLESVIPELAYLNGKMRLKGRI